MSRTLYGYQLGHTESTRFAVICFRPPVPVANVEEAITELVRLLMPILSHRSPAAIADALLFLSRGGYDSDRSWDEAVPFDPSAFREAVDDADWVFGELFADEVMQSADLWILRGWGHVYTPGDINGRKPCAFVMPEVEGG